LPVLLKGDLDAAKAQMVTAAFTVVMRDSEERCTSPRFVWSSSIGSNSPLTRGRIMRAREEGEVAWPADQVERWPLAKLIPYARNARTHSDDQIKQIAASIREFGFTNPVLVDEQGTLIAGHGRVLAAQLLDITDVPTMVARG
jgi:ParB-like nuclease domain